MVGFRKKGSLTVEAVFVVPICLLVCFLLLQALFYLHHVSWYTAAAWECVLTGLEAKESGETTEETWQEVKSQQPLPVGSVQTDISASGQTISVQIHGQMQPLPGIGEMGFDISAKRSALKPAALLRKIKGVKILTKSRG